ncbi:MAG: BMP family ABC transporter substrate-binding protein [Lachnospiraceae bacterium]|nr:BMP family ABC transporter substrate-binding protein [Lachnospiraceae bacterium]
MKRNDIVSIVVCAVILLGVFIFNSTVFKNSSELKTIKVGFVYDGDESAPYTYNYIRAQKAIEANYGDNVETIVKSNISEEEGENSLKELVSEGCELIFTTSYGYGEAAKKLAEAHPEIEFCEATCDNADDKPFCSNYHTFMGEIYSGRYISGMVAGMKLKELIESGKITRDQAKIGYVAAFPYAEVISGYTAFLLGIRHIVPEAKMTVRYTNNWTDYTLEKKYAEALIEEGAVIISQHSDTIGPAVACENSSVSHPVYHVGYNDSMLDVAPTTSLISSRINWTPYMLSAVEAVLKGEKIEKVVDAKVFGNDCSAGFERNWVQMVELNTLIAAEGTEDMIEKSIEDFKKGRITVFEGDYTGTDPFDPNDKIDLKGGFVENEKSSAPTFHYVLDDVITIEE